MKDVVQKVYGNTSIRPLILALNIRGKSWPEEISILGHKHVTCARRGPTWIDHEQTKVGYEIPFNRHFYVFKPQRPLSEIAAELKGVTDRILTMIAGLTQ